MRESIKEYFVRLNLKRAFQGKRIFSFWMKEDMKRKDDVKVRMEEARKRLMNAFGEMSKLESPIPLSRPWRDTSPASHASQSDAGRPPAGEEEKENARIEKEDLEMNFKTLAEIAKESKYKREYLGYLVRQKKLKAQKVEGVWMTSAEWVREFEEAAEARKEKNKKDLSRRMIGEIRAIGEIGGRLKSVKGHWGEAKDGWQKIFERRELEKQLAALVLVVFFVAAAGISKADFADMRGKAMRKIFVGYNVAIGKAATIAKPIEKLKVSSEKIARLGLEMLGRKKVAKFEKDSKLTLVGSDGEKAGVVMGEESFMEHGTMPTGRQAWNMEQKKEGVVLAETDASGAAYVAKPGEIEVSAYVLGADNEEIPDGEYEVRFGIYTADRAEVDPYPSDSDQGSRVWEESRKVQIKNGLLSAYLGQEKPIPENLDFGSKVYYLGIRIGEDGELVPRKRIGAVPLARVAMNIAGKSVGNGAGNIPLSNGTLNTNLNADLLDGQHASAFQPAGSYQPAGTYDNYVSWKLQTAASDAGQKIKSNKGAIFTGANGITTARTLNTLTISPTYGSTANTIAQGSTVITVNTEGNLSG